MKRILFFLLLIVGYVTDSYGQAQVKKGVIVLDSIYSEHLENKMGENPTRAISVYLPPGYDKSDQRYPVVYFLHGFSGNHIIPGIQEVLDHAINTNRIRAFIWVISDQKTTYGGSFYSNSGVFGNWEDFTVHDFVSHVDKNYRTIPKK